MATVAERDEYGRGVPLHVEAALREYLKCGILAHGFARVYCASCRHDFLVAFSCKGRDLCPSCATRRMVDVSAHMVDQVLPRVQHRQWVLSMPKRVRWHMRHKPEVIDGVFSAGDDGAAVFHPAIDLEPDDMAAVQTKMRHRGLRWLHLFGLGGRPGGP